MKIKIKKFKKEQAEKVSKLIIDSFNEFVATSFSKKGRKKQLSHINPVGFIERSKSGKREYYTALYNNRIIGIIGITKNYRIPLLFVHKKFHRKGVAKRLINKVELIFIKNGVKIIKINSSLYAVKFYEKIGYKKSRGIVKKDMTFQPMKKIIK